MGRGLGLYILPRGMTCLRHMTGTQRLAPSTDSRPAACAVRACWLAAAVSFGPPAIADHDTNCNNANAGDPIHCTKAAAATDDIDIDVSSININAATTNQAGIDARHLGSGNIDIDIDGTTDTPSRITNATDTAFSAMGIFSRKTATGGAGNITITVGNTEISTQANGIFASNETEGNATINLKPGTTVTSQQRSAVYVEQPEDGTTPYKITVTADQATLTTHASDGQGAGIWAIRQGGPGDIDMTINDSTITSHSSSPGIFADRCCTTGDDGDIDIDAVGGSTTTKGYFAPGIYALQSVDPNSEDTSGDMVGNIEITTRNHAIETQGTAHHPQVPATFAYGIWADHRQIGNIIIDMQSGSSIVTKGKNSHGIVAYHYGTGTTRDINIKVDGSVTTEGADAQGVRVGTVSADGTPSRMAALDSEGYRRHTVTVNGGIDSTAEGVFLANGGKVVIGSTGSIDSDSGIAILATGTVPEDRTDPQNVIPAIPPKLHVTLTLDGRRVAQVIGENGWIINDGGETTIVVNGVKLHDGATGTVTELDTATSTQVPVVVANGVYDVSMLVDGVTVTDRSNADPAQWTVSARTAGVIADRDFSASDFTEIEPMGECSSSPAPKNWIECTEDSTSTSDININASSIDIDTSADNVPGVKASHSGSGNIDINITGTTTTPSTIDTMGDDSQGISFEFHQNTNGMGTVTLENTQITTQGEEARGIYGLHNGIGAVTVDLNPGVEIETSGFRADGVTFTQVNRSATDNATLDAQGIRVTVRGNEASGLLAQQYGLGEVVMDIRDSTIMAQGNFGVGIDGYRNDSSGDIDIDVTGGSTTTGGYFGHGIRAWHDDVDSNADTDTGNLEITTRNHAIETQGTARHPTVTPSGTYAYGIYANNENTGNIDIDLGEGSSVITRGRYSHGIVAYQRHATSPGTIDITLDGPITVHGADAQGVRVGAVNSSGVPSRMAPLDSDGYRRQTVTVNGVITSTAEGVFLANGGRVIIGEQGSIDSAKGIAILATGTVPAASPNPAIPPKLRVDLNPNGQRMTVDEDNNPGWLATALGGGWIINDGGETTIAVNNVVLHDGATGVTGRAAPNGVWDVTMLEEGVTVTDRSNADPAQWTVSARAAGVIADRDFSASDFTETERRDLPPPPPPPDADPPTEPETVHEVNEAISAGAEAAAGVHVEGDGEVHIGAQGSLRAASGIAILATGEAPELLVDMDLAGRRVAEVIGDDWILNDGGETTIVVNEVKLHDGSTGTVTELDPDTNMQVPVVVANGVWDVSMRVEGVRVTDRSTDPANWVISEPATGVIADRDFSAEDFIETREEPEPEPEPTPPMLIEEYAPRAAVYEALPDVLLGLHARTPAAPRSAPAWFTVTGRTGSRDFDRSTVGIEVDTDYFEVETGKHVPLEGGFDAWAALHYLSGTAEVDSPVQGGDIDIEGFGASLEVRWSQAGHSYVSGQASLMNYDLDLDSDKRGRLKSGVDAYAWALSLEAGRHLQRGAVQLSPRIRLEHTNVSIDRFTDAVDARVSYPDEDRLTAALGVLAETGHDTREDGLSLWGSLDVDYTLDGARTTARVSGERLSAEAGDSSVRLGVGGIWRRDNLMVNAGLSAREELDSGSEEYGATLNLGLQF